MARFERDGEVFEITSESGAYHAQQRRHLVAGWTRVHDPRCEEPLDGEPRDPALEAALRADPFDDASVLVYADWLQQRGHPRGALIAVQHQLASRPGEAGLRDEERRLLDDAEALMSSPLVTQLAMRRARPGQPSVELAASRSMYGGGTVIWDHGFLREASVELRRRGADEDLLWELLRHPSARFLTALDLRVARDRDLALATALLLHGPRPPLRRLAIHSDADPDGELTLELAGLAEAFPALEDLELAADRVRFRELSLPALRRLVLVTAGHGDDIGRVLEAATWPALEELSLARPDVRELALALDRPAFPRLRVLRLAFVTDGVPALCRAIVGSPQAAQLEVLDLARTRLDAPAIDVLVAQRARFARLTALRVIADEVDARALAELRAAGYPLALVADAAAAGP